LKLSLSLSSPAGLFSLFVFCVFILGDRRPKRLALTMAHHQNDHRDDQKGGGGERSVKTLFAGDKVKQMKEKAGKMSALSSAFAKTVKKTTSTMKIPQIGTMSTVNRSNTTTTTTNTNNINNGGLSSSYGRQSPGIPGKSSFEGTSPIAFAAMEEERRARTIGVNTTQQQYSTKEDEETMRRLREQLVDAQMRHDETAKVVLHLQEDVERIQREKEDLRVKSAKIWQEQQDALAAKETERKTREEEGEAREKAREMEVANLVAKVNQLERERAKEKEMKAESDVKVDVGKFEEEIADLRKKLEAERGKVVAAEKSVAEEKAKTEKVLADASVAASVAVTPTSSEEEKSEEEALKKEIESVKTENEKLKAEIETIRASESKLREENQTLQSTASTSTQDKSASESEHKKNMDALTLELSAVQSKLSSEIESDKKSLEDARKQLENERASAKKSVDDTIMKSENHVAELDKEISNLKAQLDLSNVEKTETTEKFELLLATRDEEVKSLEKNIKDALAEMQSIRNELNVAKEAVQVANETSKAALNGAEDAEKAREETKEEMKALQLKLDHAEEALKNTQISAPNLERQIAEKNALKSTLADVRYERDVLANMLKDMKKKVGAYSMETPPILRAVNDAKKNLNGFMSRFQGTGSTSTVKKNTTTAQAPASASASKNPNTKSPSAAATPQKLNFSQPAAALTPP